MKCYPPPPNLGKTSLMILDAFAKARSVLEQHEHPYVSVSGGKDSDIMMDLIWRLAGDKVTYVFYNTGIEWQATKRHLAKLEARYNVPIKRIQPKLSVPACVKKYGQPFLSKIVSHCIERLQVAGFDFTDQPLDVLLEKFPKQRCYVRWWCNDYTSTNRPTGWCVGKFPNLRRYLIEHPPVFAISSKCCQYAKKYTAQSLIATKHYDLECTGIRKAEGGVRSIRYKSCYSFNSKKAIDSYRPLFWFSNEDEQIYSDWFEIRHSDCYTLWGFARTGCAGCPFSKNVDHELALARPFEPNTVLAAEHLFGNSYAATRQLKTMYKSNLQPTFDFS